MPSIKGSIPNKLTKEEIEEIKEKINKWENNHSGGFEKIFPEENVKKILL